MGPAWYSPFDGHWGGNPVQGDEFKYGCIRRLIRVVKWSITPVPRQADTFKILPLYKDTSLNADIGMTKNDAFYNPDREFQYLSQIVGLDGVSGNWKIVRDPSGQFSRSGISVLTIIVLQVADLPSESILRAPMMSWHAMIIIVRQEPGSQRPFISCSARTSVTYRKSNFRIFIHISITLDCI